MAQVRGEDIATIMSTSGSTGTPKGVAISHRALVARALLIHRELGIDENDAFLGWAPTFHISSTDYLFATCTIGGTFVTLPGFDATAIADELASRRVGWLMLMPGLIDDVLTALGERSVVGLRCVGAMADLVPPDQLRSLTSRLSTRYVNSFGSTEAGLAPGASLVELDDGSQAPDLGKRPTRHCQYRVVDPAGHDVPLDGVGELLLRGPTIFSGYWSEAGLSRADFENGWFRTGDLVRHRQGPLLDFVDRATYMVKTGGENVYPAVVEREFQRHPDVVSVATVPTPHPRLHTVLSAYVSLRAGAGPLPEVVAACIENLASYERPYQVHRVEDGAFVRGVTGKIDRAALARIEHHCGADCVLRS
jgi:fatty-acyl-CoA synthase